MISFPDVVFTPEGLSGSGNGSGTSAPFGPPYVIWPLGSAYEAQVQRWEIISNEVIVASSDGDTKGFEVNVVDLFAYIGISGLRGSVNYPEAWDEDEVQGELGFTVRVIISHVIDYVTGSFYIAHFRRPRVKPSLTPPVPYTIATEITLKKTSPVLVSESYYLPEWFTETNPPRAPLITKYEIDWMEGEHQETGATNIGPNHERQATPTEDIHKRYLFGREYFPVAKVRVMDDLGRRSAWRPINTYRLMLARVGVADDHSGTVLTCEGHYGNDDGTEDLWIRSSVAGEPDPFSQYDKIGIVPGAWYPTLVREVLGSHLLLTLKRETEDEPEHWQLWRSPDYGHTWEKNMTLPDNADDYVALTMCALWEGGVAMVGLKRNTNSDFNTLGLAISRDLETWSGFHERQAVNFPQPCTIFQQAISGQPRIIVTNGINTILELPPDLDE